MKWAVSEKFKDYLWGTRGTKVTVITDNNPLIHLKTAKLGTVEQRWVAQLANFDYEIQYRPGKEHSNADVLSRLPATGGADVTPSSIEMADELLVGVVEAPGTQEEGLPASWEWMPVCWRQLQEDDVDLATVRAYVEKGRLPPASERHDQTQLSNNFWASGAV